MPPVAEVARARISGEISHALHAPKVCIFAPVPPPWHGSAYAVRLLLDSSFAREVVTTHINAVFATDIANLGKAELRKAGQLLVYLGRLLRICRRRRIDIVIVIPAFTFLPFLKDSLVILATAAFSRARILVWSHSNDGLSFYKSRGPIFRAYMRFVLRRAAHIVTVGDALRPNFAPFVSADRVTTIANGLPARASVQARTRHQRLQVIYLSNMLRAKGWRVLLEAAARLCRSRDDIEFKFYGAPSSDSSTEDILLAFEQAGGDDRIRYMGPVYGEDKERAIAGADVFCLPTSYPTEALPISILEAMQHGLAIISTPVGAIGEVVIPEIGGLLVQPESVRDLTAALQRLAEDRDATERMGTANRVRFEEQYAMERIARRWIDLVKRLTMRTDEC